MNCKAIYFNLATLDAYLIEVKDGEYYFIIYKEKHKNVLHTVFVVFNS